jgi:hypothetical protein
MNAYLAFLVSLIFLFTNIDSSCASNAVIDRESLDTQEAAPKPKSRKRNLKITVSPVKVPDNASSDVQSATLLQIGHMNGRQLNVTQREILCHSAPVQHQTHGANQTQGSGSK